MKILYVTNGYKPYRWAGTETYTAGIAEEMAQRGHAVQVLCAGEWNKGNAYWNGISDDIQKGIPVKRIHLNWTKSPDPFRYLYDNPVVDAGLFEEKNGELHGCEDWDLWLRLAPSHQFAGIRESLVRYRLHANTFSANPSQMQDAVKTVVEKNFGVDDGKYGNWSDEKKRAYGGVYRYRTLTSVQKQGDWEIATESLGKAFKLDSTLVADLDLFYELTFGAQPAGYRETTYHLELEQNAKLILDMLAKIFDTREFPALDRVRKVAFGTANYAIGLVAYNTTRRDLSKRYLFQALTFLPGLLLDRRIVLTLIKSYIRPSFVTRLKQVVNGGNHAR